MDKKPQDIQAYENTDRELWRKGDGDGNGMSYYEPTISVTQNGLIDIGVGGDHFVLPVEKWHKLAEDKHTKLTDLKPLDVKPSVGHSKAQP